MDQQKCIAGWRRKPGRALHSGMGQERCSRSERQARDRGEFEENLQVGLFTDYLGDTRMSSLVAVDGSCWGTWETGLEM